LTAVSFSRFEELVLMKFFRSKNDSYLSYKNRPEAIAQGGWAICLI
jgi:hypothetical protein